MTTAVTLSADPVLQFFNVDGTFLAGGTLTTLVGGVLYPTWSESTGTFSLPNPIILNPRGEVCTATGTSSPLYVQAGVAYTYTLQDSLGNTIWTQQNITSPLTGSQVLALLTQSLIGGTLWPQTPAEQAANVTPTNFAYQEGDIRRYGANVSASTNHTFITAALTVSAAGGNATYIPGGTWPITSPVVVAPLSSMYGAGNASNILTSACDGLQFINSDPGIIATSRFFRDFQLTGTIVSGTNANHGIFINAGAVSGVQFSNLTIQNFQWGAYVQGLYYSVFSDCFIQNCWFGILFNNQSVQINIRDCNIQLTSNGPVITGTGTSAAISWQGAPEVEGLLIQGSGTYGYGYGIGNGSLIFQVQIEAATIANCSVCPIFFGASIGGVEITDCWCELGTATTGSWGTPTANLTGIYISAVTPSVFSKTHIRGNNIICDGVFLSGSTGVYIGNGNSGVSVHDNNIVNFDIGISGGNGIVNTGGALVGASIKNNQITANTASIRLNSLSSELELGPNYITSGGQVVFNSGTPVSMTYNQPDTPMKGTAQFAAATFVAVLFTNPLPVGVIPRVSISGNLAGYCYVSLQANTGFTIACAVSNSNTVDWQISV
jgi:hypothetical protein